MQSPVKKIYITQIFGANPSNYAKFGLKGHNGIDFRAFLPNGERCYESGKSEVFAPHSGKVIECAFDASGSGIYVKIEDATQGSVLAHLSSLPKVNIGDTVKQGQFVGFQGTTGNSTGIHLHWGWYPIPRNRNNGYNGYENQEGKYKPYQQGEDMLLTYLGTATEEEAKAKLKEHLGEVSSKCNWGSEGDQGGFLGSARKEVRSLKEANKVQAREIVNLRLKIEELEDDILPSEPVEWVENGKTVEVTNGNTKTIINYRRTE